MGNYMNEEFSSLVRQLPELLERLSKSPLRPWDNLGSLPLKGVYVFHEGGKPIYVGRTDNMKRRLQQHGRPSSTHNSAPFAFNIAKSEAAGKGISTNMTRSELENDPRFDALFRRAKQRVSKMNVRVIDIDDPIMQSLFEVYASIALETREYNYFDTH